MRRNAGASRRYGYANTDAYAYANSNVNTDLSIFSLDPAQLQLFTNQRRQLHLVHRCAHAGQPRFDSGDVHFYRANNTIPTTPAITLNVPDATVV